MFSAGQIRDTVVIAAQGEAHTTIATSDIMKSNAKLTYRGLPFQMTVCNTIETQQQATFLGRKAAVISPVKTPVTLPADMQFFGRQATAATLSKTIDLASEEWAPA